jgi:hypothetical protein
MVRRNKGNYVPVSKNRALEISANVSKFAEVTDLLKVVIKGATHVGIAFFIYRIVEVLCLNLAGKETIANIGIELSFIWPLATFVSTSWALAEKRSKGLHIERLSRENKELKRKLDPNLGTSSLRPNGETRLEDVE